MQTKQTKHFFQIPVDIVIASFKTLSFIVIVTMIILGVNVHLSFNFVALAR